MDIGNIRINLPRASTPGVGCLLIVCVIIGWLLLVSCGILASAILVDALYHLGHFILGW
jgi:hypothetical protein